MSSEAKSLLEELDKTLSKTSELQQVSILRRVTDLFLGNSERLSGDHVAVFGDVIVRLIEKAEHSALVELTNRLAPVTNAPENVVVCLSRHDDIAVSGPVLEKSNMLTDESLGEIAKTKGQKHLAAIADRAQISETVTDILADRGNAEIAYKVTRNQDARLSELGFVKLINKAKNDKALAATIAKRTDIPPELQPFLKLALA